MQTRLNKMSALTQYINLYNENREVIEGNSPAPLNALRAKALQALDGASLPRRGDEDYEVTSLDEMFAPDYGVNIHRVQLGADPATAFRCDVPNMSTRLYFFFNDVFHPSRTALAATDGVVVEPLSRAAHTHADLIEKYLGKIAPMQEPQVALNSLLAQEGLLVYVPKGVVVEKPLQLVQILNAQAPVLSALHIVVIAEENSQVKLLVCDHTQNKDVDFLASQVIEIYAKENAQVDFYEIEESTPRTNRCASVYVDQSRGSNVLIDGITLMNGTTRNNYVVNVNGENAETRLLGMAILSGKQHVDNHTFIAHNVGHCVSNELFKYVLDDDSVGAFSGKILVAHGAPRVEAYQSNRNIVSKPTAKMHTKPQLEIYTDDVKCSHGAAIGQLDQEALFYMQARGIDLAEARTMLMQAFMSDVIEGVRFSSLRDRLTHLVEKRFSGELMSCGECGSCSNINNNL